MAFVPKTLDYTVSPYTGLTRQSWIEAGTYLLEGVFQNIAHFEDPVVMPRKETKVTYPHSADAVWEFKAEYFEGLARSFFIAAPLIHDNPDLNLCGYSIRDYYKSHVLRACTKGDPVSVGRYEELQEMAGDYNRAFQQTVETCALVICLWVCKEEIWDTYTKEERDVIAEFLRGYADGNTVPQNWRLFNMLDMAFLDMEGYEIDEEIMLDHAQSILAYYAGDGWYRDGHSFDYYSCWAFNVYAPIWNLWYGYEKQPYIAAKFEEHSNKLMETYADFFDRDGFTNMWGRSNIYRNAATSAFDGNLMLHNSTADPGLARRISSGSLLQFMTRDDFLFKGVPTLGFYGQFTPLVQGYSCAESPFWLGKAFLCLHLPADHPFWTAKETNGTWEKLQKDEVKETTLSGPALWRRQWPGAVPRSGQRAAAGKRAPCSSAGRPGLPRPAAAAAAAAGRRSAGTAPRTPAAAGPPPEPPARRESGCSHMHSLHNTACGPAAPHPEAHPAAAPGRRPAPGGRPGPSAPG